MENFVKDYLNAVCKTQITPIEVFMSQQEKKDYYIVDVRIGASEFLGEKIAGANNIPLNELFDNVNELPKTKEILVYTWGIECTLAKKALLLLAEAGFEALEIAGGIESWKKANLPVEKIER